MFGIGPLELVVIAIVAIVVIGPDKLPDTMKKFGKFFVQARRHANDVKDTFHQVIHDAERELEVERIREIQAKIQATSPAQILDAEIQKASTATHEEDHAPYGTEAYDQPHDHADNPDYVSMDHFAKAPDPVSTVPVVANSPATTPAEPSPSAAEASIPETTVPANDESKPKTV